MKLLKHVDQKLIFLKERRFIIGIGVKGELFSNWVRIYFHLSLFKGKQIFCSVFGFGVVIVHKPQTVGDRDGWACRALRGQHL